MAVPISRAEAWTFDDFEVGTDLGTVELTLDERRLGLWRQIYGEEHDNGRGDGGVAPGMLVAAMMEGYIKAIQPRPPGNIHAGQTLAFTSHAVKPGARIALTFSCLAKALVRERRRITFAVRAFDDGALVMSGEIQSIWAA